jgi:FKBP-type peptidyl-prolyl cis-trans isomerase
MAAGAFAALLGAAGCAESPTVPSSYSPFVKTDLVIGTGDEATAGQSVTVNYTGWLYDVSQPNQRGAQFDSSIGVAPFAFTLGGNQVIKGWEQGVPGMKVGGVRQLVIPPSLAYGDTRHNSIPPNATLVFEIELVSVP